MYQGVISIFLSLLVACSTELSNVPDPLAKLATAIPTAPGLGCVAATSSALNFPAPSWVCSSPTGACILSFLDICDASVDGYYPDDQVVVRVGVLSYAVQYFKQQGGARVCRRSNMPECCGTSSTELELTAAQGDSDCKCVVHTQTKERFCDPVGCEEGESDTKQKQSLHLKTELKLAAAQSDSDCKCVVHKQTKERFCDPVGCEEGKSDTESSSKKESHI